MIGMPPSPSQRSMSLPVRPIGGRPYRAVAGSPEGCRLDGPPVGARYNVLRSEPVWRRSPRPGLGGDTMTTAVIVDAVRTPGGKRNGKLRNWHAVDLASEALRAVAERNKLDP